jgi:hypothetical protein
VTPQQPFGNLVQIGANSRLMDVRKIAHSIGVDKKKPQRLARQKLFLSIEKRIFLFFEANGFGFAEC